MPLRLDEYDIITYLKQYQKNAEKYKERGDLTEEEFLSKMRRTDRFLPVISIVIYYGEKAWDGPKTLCEMLNIPNELKEFVNDYKMNLVEVRNNNLIFHNHQNRDLFQLCKILYNSSFSVTERRQQAIQYDQENQTDRSVILAVASATGCKTILKGHGKKGNGNMCTLWEEVEKESEARGESRGEARGKITGIAQGIIEMSQEFGLSDQEILQKLQTKLNLTLQQAKEYLVEFGKTEPI